MADVFDRLVAAIADRWEEAYSVVKGLSEEFSENVSYRGVVGVLAAYLGRRDGALEVSRRL